MRRFIAAIALLALFITPLAAPSISHCKEGKLGKFEKEVGRKSAPKGDSDSGSSSSYTDTTSSVSGTEIATDAAMSLFYSFFLMGLTTGATESGHELYEYLKLTDSPALPTIKVDAAYHFLTDNIHGVIGKVEAGYLTFGLQGEYQRYFESDATDLSFISGHFLLRTLFARVIGINLALGAKSIWGVNKQTGFDFGFPFYVYFNRYLILDAQPYIAFISGNRVYDLALGFSFKYKPVGVRVAYRTIYTGSQTLHGPQVGVFIQW